MTKPERRQSIARKHHHVPRSYLQNWGTANGQVFFSRHGVVNTLPTNPANLLAKRDFYRMPLLTERAIRFLGQYVERSFADPHVRAHAKNILYAYVSFSRLEVCVDKLPLASASTKEQVRRTGTTVGEHYLSRIENRATTVLEELRRGNVTVLDSEEAEDFFLFLGIQFLRTRTAREGISQAVEISLPDAGSFAKGVEQVLAHIHGETMGGLLYSQRSGHRGIVLQNDTDRAFVSGDQPIINLLAPLDDSAPTKTVLYYPLSPYRAFLWLPKAVGRALRPVSSEMVKDLNVWIADASHECVIGNSLAAVEAVEVQRPFRRPEMARWIVP